jgi:hypothetical protein
MHSCRDRLHGLVDALADTQVEVALSFLAELSNQETRRYRDRKQTGYGP